MAACPKIDSTRTLAQLTGTDWGPPPPNANTLVRERHEIRTKRLESWTHAELIRFLRMGVDEHVLILAAIERVENDPVASACGEEAAEGELLCHVLESTAVDWRNNAECVQRIRQTVGSAENLIFQTDDPWAQTKALMHLYRSHRIFERRLSSIP